MAVSDDDRIQPGANLSYAYSWEFATAFGGLSEGWIIPGDSPSAAAKASPDIEEDDLEAFDIETEAGSLSVEIQPGEGHLYGWLCRPDPTALELEADTADQVIAVGWRITAGYDEDIHEHPDDADEVLIDLEEEFAPNTVSMPVWSVDTDADEVVDVEDLRRIGPSVDLQEAGAERQLAIPVFETLEDVPDDRDEGSLYWIEDEESLYIEDGEV